MSAAIAVEEATDPEDDLPLLAPRTAPSSQRVVELPDATQVSLHHHTNIALPTHDINT